jgi:hypothetical protein
MWLTTGSSAESSGVAIGTTLITFITSLCAFITFGMSYFLTASIMAALIVWELTIVTQGAFLG